jgi:hypothetical protein
MEAFIIKLIIYIIISYLLNYLFADDGPDVADSEPGTVKVPVVTASDPVPVLFGTLNMEQPNCVWYGDIEATPWEKCS